MKTAKILVVDDEQNILSLINAYLEPEGYDIRTAIDGNEALALAESFQPDLIILDIMLPGKDGIEVLAQLRRDSDVYVIMLTAKTEETDKIVGLTVGADDYVTKPFSPRELAARVKSALRRLQSQSTSRSGQVMTFARTRIDTGSRQYWLDDSPVELTAIEFDLVTILAEYKGMVLSREQLLEKVWGYDYFGEIRVVDVHVGNIRKKLGTDEIIQTVRGIGYRYEDEV